MFNVDFRVDNNADWRDAFQVLDDLDQPESLVNTALEMEVRDVDGTRVFELTTANGYLKITDAETGRFEIDVPKAKVMDVDGPATVLPVGTYYYDLRRYAAGETDVIMFGQIVVRGGISADS